MEFRKYQHVERLGTIETEGIMCGRVHVFPKIDGTNGSVWLGEKRWLCYGSRKRQLSLEADNAGFMASLFEADDNEQSGFHDLLLENPNLKLYGEWLVPNTLKTYTDEAWRRFYVFDVVSVTKSEDGLTDEATYLPYEEYQPILEEFGVEYIPPLAIIDNPSTEQLYAQLERNDYLMKPGEIGEGIVIKNYLYRNKFGRPTWAKIVRSEFKAKHVKTMGAPEMAGQLTGAVRFVNEYCTIALIDKVFAAISVAEQGWSSRYIPRLLNTVLHDLIKEDMWHGIKKFKNPTIDFKYVHQLVVQKIKEYKPELF